MTYLREALDELLIHEDENPAKAKLQRAKASDLVTLPDNVEGTNCSNCKFVRKAHDEAHCINPKVDQVVNARMCCALWDAPGTKRAWKPSSREPGWLKQSSHRTPQEGW